MRPTPVPFSELLRRRSERWWGGRATLGCRPGALHRLREWYTFRSRDDPPQRWRCCALWQRLLLNKWNAREFAARHGAAVPQLYAWGLPALLPLARLPRQFVIRPVRGTGRRGVHVVSDGRELLRDQPASIDALRARLRRPFFEAWTVPVLAEEFVRNEAGQHRLPLEYKCHSFAGTIAAVQVMERLGPALARHRYYTTGFEPLPDDLDAAFPPLAPQRPPAFLPEMLRQAETLGAALGVYMRIDFFASDHGCVFNEFSSVPRVVPSPRHDAHLGALWAEKLGAAT